MYCCYNSPHLRSGWLIVVFYILHRFAIQSPQTIIDCCLLNRCWRMDRMPAEEQAKHIVIETGSYYCLFYLVSLASAEANSLQMR